MTETLPAPTIPMPGSMIALNKEEQTFKKSVSALNDSLANLQVIPMSTVPRIPQPAGNDSGMTGSHVTDSGSDVMIRSQSAHPVDNFSNPLAFSSSLGHFPFGFALEESSSLAQIGKDPDLDRPGSSHRSRDIIPELSNSRKASQEANILEMTNTDNFDLVDRKIRELYASMNKTSTGFEPEKATSPAQKVEEKPLAVVQDAAIDQVHML